MEIRVVLSVGMMGVLLAGGPAACDGTDADGTGSVSGVVTRTDGRPVGDAVVRVGERSSVSDFEGAYVVTAVPAGPVTVEVDADWLEPSAEQGRVEAGRTLSVDFTLAARPLGILPVDRALYEQALGQLDWSRDDVSVHLVDTPTRAEIDKALYRRNPALYQDTSSAAPLVPANPPQIADGAASGFDFPVTATGQPDQPALEEASLVDRLSDTGVSQDAQRHSLLWEPAIDLFLAAEDPTLAQGLYAVGRAVEQQAWGGTGAFAAQRLERVYLDAGQIWVEVVFEPWLTLGPGISDSDGDGFEEVYGRVAAGHYSSEAVDRLVQSYQGPALDTLSLVDNLHDLCDDLYSRTNPKITQTVGEPYSVPDVGTFEYPFAVIEHAAGQVNVLLVGSAGR